ncbi:phosphoribosylformylglycinamidine cyclo-ligase [bacterium]|nr:phosphoribosylformylglycinamidine cyclo-ligase [bacterium]
MSTSAYQKLGVSATKEEVHRAIAGTDPGLFPGAFCRIGTDVLGGDPDYCSALHSDDAGTKAIVAYLQFRETGNADIFRGIAQDALVMNLDDLLCIGAVDRFLLGNTINRNSFVIPGSVIGEAIAGYSDVVKSLLPYGIEIVATGGETADMNDAVRTIIIGATLATRLRRDQVIDNSRIQPGDVIVGFSSTGQAVWESRPNSGIGDNGLTLARHALLHRDYGTRFPESMDPGVDRQATYRGPFHLSDRPAGLPMTIGEAILSPTRTYAPLLKKIFDVVGRSAIHGLVHNTGGGQTKCKSFGKSIKYVKTNLFPVPRILELIAEHGQVESKEMYQTFNMGHRLEAMVDPKTAPEMIRLSQEMGIEAQVVGVCETSPRNVVEIRTPTGSFEYT